ncbi:hypothetical protein BDZ97DRAFT_1756578 [Flammula alnicola]|nr:hypothetical protein BDZ97DRAFT_1756578 [Flammula alnicola]
MVSNNLNVPQDIIDTIIDILAQNCDRNSLKACSLVNGSFLEPCQKKIFSTVTLAATGRPHRWDPQPTGDGVDIRGIRMYRLLQTSPHIAQYVRVLKMQARNPIEYRWMTGSDETAAIIDAFIRVETFEFGSNFPMVWPKFHPSVKSSLISIMHSPNLQNLKLDNLHELPVFLVLSFGTITTLDLRDSSCSSSVTTSIESTVQVSNRRENLRTLFVTESDSVLRCMIRPDTPFQYSAVDFAGLRTLDIQLRTRGDTYLVDDLLRKTTNLDNLHIILTDTDRTSSFNTILTHERLTRIRHISFCLEPSLLQSVYSFIQSIPNSSSLEEVEVMCVPYLARHEGVEEIQRWSGLKLDLPIQRLKIRFFLEEYGNPQDHGDCREVFYGQLRPRVQGNLLALIMTGKVKIVAHGPIRSFGDRHFWTEVSAIRRSLIMTQ